MSVATPPRRHSRRFIALVGCALVAIAVVIVLLVTGGSKPTLFSASSVWNSPVAPDAALDPSSAKLAGALAAEAAKEEQAGTGPFIQTFSYTTPLYTVPSDQPTVKVSLTEPTLSWRRTLQRAFLAVPLPADARPAPGTDAELTVWQPSRDRLWEFWQLKKTPSGWQAAWGGAMQNVSSNPGYFTPDSWAGAASNWGATATSLPAIGGTMLISELQHGLIPHALAMAIPAARQGLWTWPAQRSDGVSKDPLSLPEGAHLRLDPNLDLTKLHLPPFTRMMAVAAQRYGIVVRDQTAASIGFYAEDPAWAIAHNAPNPYTPLFGGKTPNQLLASFPWSHLQLLRMHVCTDANVPCRP